MVICDTISGGVTTADKTNIMTITYRLVRHRNFRLTIFINNNNANNNGSWNTNIEKHKKFRI